ncbi:MAG: hypothetical protein ACRESZ_22165 [Methylococcales bacterium]
MSKGKNNFELTHPNAAGIDIGASSHFVAVPPDRDEPAVREFPGFTGDLIVLADWLGACGVEPVAMESTGVYGRFLCLNCWNREALPFIW